MALGGSGTLFGTEGDSGSLVIDTDGTAVGLLIACESTLGVPYHFALITPIEEVIKSIEKAIKVVEQEDMSKESETMNPKSVKIDIL